MIRDMPITSFALRLVELGSVVSLIVLWLALGTLFFAIVRHSKNRRDPGDPGGL